MVAMEISCYSGEFNLLQVKQNLIPVCTRVASQFPKQINM